MRVTLPVRIGPNNVRRRRKRRPHRRRAAPDRTDLPGPGVEPGRLAWPTLLRSLPLRAVMCRLHRTTCDVCGGEIPGAATMWVPRLGADDSFFVCYTCGVGVMHWYGALSVDQVDQVPPWCGAPE